MVNYTNTLSDAEVKDTIIQLLQSVNRDGIENLIDYLTNKSDFFTAPASTRFHGAKPGYLARHSLNVYYRLLALLLNERDTYKRWEDDKAWAEVSESAIIVGLLHDICKTNFYVLGSRNVKNKETGQWESVPVYTIDDKLPYGHGEKSVYIASAYIQLNREEAMSIRWHMGGFDNAVMGGDYGLNVAFDKFPLALLTHLADMQASHLDELEG